MIPSLGGRGDGSPGPLGRRDDGSPRTVRSEPSVSCKTDDASSALKVLQLHHERLHLRAVTFHGLEASR